MAIKLYDDTKEACFVSAFVLNYIGLGLCLLADSYKAEFGESDFLFAGGVMSNSIIKSMLKERYSASFAEPVMSSDNAVGIAELARRKYIL